jgi:hypothetical protein
MASSPQLGVGELWEVREKWRRGKWDRGEGSRGASRLITAEMSLV